MNCIDVADLSPLYLSGELEAARAADFDEHVKGCADCAHDVELDRRLRRAVLAEPIDTASADCAIRRVTARRSRWRPVSIAAGIAATLVVGILIYRAAARAAPIYAAAAQDHRREVIDHELRNWVTQPEQLIALASRLGISESAPASIDGYRLEHAKLCRLNGRVFLHAVYSDGSREFSLFLCQPESHGSPIRIEGSDGQKIAAFETAHVTAMIVADRADDAAGFAQAALAAL
jgi:anti-sigma factor RsiW